MYYLIKVDENYFIVQELEPTDIVVCEDTSLAVVEAAKKIAKKTGAVKLQ